MFAYLVETTDPDGSDFAVIAVFVEQTPAAELAAGIKAADDGRLVRVSEFAIGQVPADYRQVLL